jgi:hypothetical protein
MLEFNYCTEMQNAHVKALVITNYCSLSSLVEPDTVRRALCSSLKMYLWLIKQFKSIENDISILGASSSVVDRSLQKK